jgi:hypothetical protein
LFSVASLPEQIILSFCSVMCIPAKVLLEEVGVSMAECTRQIGVTTSGVAQVLRRQE